MTASLAESRPRLHPISGALAVRDVTLTALAATTGYSVPHLSAVIHRDRPATRRVRAACSLALGLPADELFDDGPDDDPGGAAALRAA